MGIKKDICILPCDAGNIKKEVQANGPFEFRTSIQIVKKQDGIQKNPYCSKMEQIF